ncbi:uncharacterized protein DFL_008316 [Arthrobotrys flagrans]|uniref:F-box domain-containing protein n=1 Tax=Arthrobotrys flagrans TaxID=97331 RepID=A0A436ZNE4_ARTFL|nr:hypothetical protein DFL_008316 [Arthrobotrys flagrans]
MLTRTNSATLPVRALSLAPTYNTPCDCKGNAKVKKCYLAKVPNEIIIQIMSLLPVEAQLCAAKAFPRFRVVISLQIFKEGRYTWEGHQLSFKGKHGLFSVENGYLECTATSGIVESCLLRQDSQNYYVNASVTADPTPFLEDDVFTGLPIGFTHRDLHDRYRFRPSTDPRLDYLEVSIWVFDECGNPVTYEKRCVTDLLKLIPGGATRPCTIRQLLKGIGYGVENFLGRGLRKRAHYGKKCEFQVFQEKADGSLRVEAHPVLDEIWPFPTNGKPSTGPPALLRTHSNPLYRRKFRFDLTKPIRPPTPDGPPDGFRDRDIDTYYDYYSD